MRAFSHRSIGFWIWLCLWLTGAADLRAEAVRIAAASSLRFELEPLVAAFRQQRDVDVHVNYAASGTLAQQILHGAPYEIFLSASPRHLQPLQASGALCDGPALLGHGRLVLFVPHHSRVPLQGNLQGLAAASWQRLAIADPRVAPFGLLAQQALQSAGVWHQVQTRLVYGENAAQAARFALSGAVDAALLPRQLVRDPVFARRGKWTPVAETLYRPTPIQGARTCQPSKAAAVLFDYLRRHWPAD